ncbi:hypothetical protein Taro_009809, partial [Colocasia esculenta]|nr:hypothetical protein [Colocasia esculenta]
MTQTNVHGSIHCLEIQMMQRH